MNSLTNKQKIIFGIIIAGMVVFILVYFILNFQNINKKEEVSTDTEGEMFDLDELNEILEGTSEQLKDGNATNNQSAEDISNNTNTSEENTEIIVHVAGAVKKARHCNIKTK